MSLVRYTDRNRKLQVADSGYYSGVASSSGDNTLVAGVEGKKIRVVRYAVSASAAVNAFFKSSTSRISGTKYMAIGGGWAGGEAAELGHFETAAGEALVLNLSGAVPCGVDLSYNLEDA